MLKPKLTCSHDRIGCLIPTFKLLYEKNLTYSNHFILADLKSCTGGTSIMAVSRDQLENYLETMEKELDRTVNFWLENSRDIRNG